MNVTNGNDNKLAVLYKLKFKTAKNLKILKQNIMRYT